MADKEHPHMCTISLDNGGFHVFAGAGSLISPNMVLSLASGVSKFRRAATEEPLASGEGQILDKTAETVSVMFCFSAKFHRLQSITFEHGVL